MTTLTQLPKAPIWRKLSAMIYDWLVLAAVSMAYGAMALTIKVRMLGYTLAEGEKANLGLSGFIGWLVIMVAFYSFFWHRGGQTLGMRAWRLQLVTDDYRYPSWAACIVRAAVASVSFFALGAGYWWQWQDREQKTWHDRASGTQVLLLPKKS